MDRSVSAADARATWDIAARRNIPWRWGCRPQHGEAIESCLKEAAVNGSPDAMNMASTAIFTSTMFGMLHFKPHVNSLKGDP
jgi:hypothetical protein